MVTSKLTINKDKWLEKLTSGLIEKLSDSDGLCFLAPEEIAAVDKVIEAHLDGVLNEISEFDLVPR